MNRTVEKEVLSAYINATQWIYATEINELGTPNFTSRFADILNRMQSVRDAMNEMVCT